MLTLQQGTLLVGLALAVFALAVAGSWIAMQRGPIVPALGVVALVLLWWLVWGW